MALAVTFTWAGASGNTAASQLDQDFTDVVTYINNRNPTSGLLSARPAAANAGALYFATDTGLLYLDSGSAWSTVGLGLIGTGALVGHLGGLGLSNDGTSPNTVIDVAAGICADSTGVYGINIGAFTKSTGGTWAAGTGGNGMGAGLTIANNTWYHVFAITNNALSDVYFDTSVTAANKPASTTAFRRLGSFKTATGTTNILAFTQDGDYFRWAASVADVSASPASTAAVTRTLTVPTGVHVWAEVALSASVNAAAGGINAYLSDLAANDEAATSGLSQVFGLAQTADATGGAWEGYIRTNTSAQIRSRLDNADASAAIKIGTLGWMDRRGRG